jgi:hypothetical protein
LLHDEKKNSISVVESHLEIKDWEELPQSFELNLTLHHKLQSSAIKNDLPKLKRMNFTKQQFKEELRRFHFEWHDYGGVGV